MDIEPPMHAQPAPALRLPSPTRLAGGLRAWSARHPGAVAMAALLSFAAPLKFFVGFLGAAREPAAGGVAQVGLWWLLYGAILWVGLLAGGQAGMRTIATGSPRRRALSWLLLAVACSAVANLATLGRAGILVELGIVQGVIPMLLYAMLVSVTLAMLYFAHLDRTHSHERAAARLAAAQAAQREARRRFVQVDLQTTQARIDPALLFDMLEAVRRAYAGDAARAEHLLDELVAFLRACLPRVRMQASSLAREMELARSYLRLLSLARERDWALRLEVAGEAMHARFPPGVLLPLLDGALRGGGGDCTLRADCAGGVCRLALALPSPASEASAARVRALLQETDGPAASLSLAQAGRLVTIRVPHEPA